MDEWLSLLWGTVTLRPYVFGFLAVYLVAAGAHAGWRRALLFIPLGYAIAWASEYASITWGFPYGDYFYIETTRGRELWVLGVPFMDSLSYVFLSYCSFATAVYLLSPVSHLGRVRILETRAIRGSLRVLVLGACLFVFLDIIIDPVAFRGSRWFLGQIYGYRSEGLYFGIPMSNFGGWLLVGLAMVFAFQRLSCARWLDGPRRRSRPRGILLAVALYGAVLAFNLSVTFAIGERFLGIVGSLLVFFPALLGVCFTLYKAERMRRGDVLAHLSDFPDSEALSLLHSFGDDEGKKG